MNEPEREVTLREVRSDDLPLFFAHQADPVAARMAAFRPRGRDAFFAHWSSILRDERVIARTVLLGREVAGHVVSFESAGRRLVGYWIGREFWGRGVASAAVAAFLEVDAARPLHAFVAAANAASIRVLERCGFRERARRTDPAGVAEILMELS